MNQNNMAGGVFTSRFELRTFSLRVVSFVRYVFEDMAYFDTFLYFFSWIMYAGKHKFEKPSRTNVV